MGEEELRFLWEEGGFTHIDFEEFKVDFGSPTEDDLRFLHKEGGFDHIPEQEFLADFGGTPKELSPAAKMEKEAKEGRQPEDKEISVTEIGPEGTTVQAKQEEAAILSKAGVDPNEELDYNITPLGPTEDVGYQKPEEAIPSMDEAYAIDDEIAEISSRNVPSRTNKTKTKGVPNTTDSPYSFSSPDDVVTELAVGDFNTTQSRVTNDLSAEIEIKKEEKTGVEKKIILNSTADRYSVLAVKDFAQKVESLGGDERAMKEVLEIGATKGKHSAAKAFQYNSRALSEKYPVDFLDYLNKTKGKSEEAVAKINEDYPELVEDELFKELAQLRSKNDQFDAFIKKNNTILKEAVPAEATRQAAEERAQSEKDIDNGVAFETFESVFEGGAREVGRIITTLGGVYSFKNKETGGKVARFGEDLEARFPKSSNFEGVATEYAVKVNYDNGFFDEEVEVIYEDEDSKFPMYVRDANGFQKKYLHGIPEDLIQFGNDGERKKRINKKVVSSQIGDAVADLFPQIATTAVTGGALTALGASAKVSMAVGTAVSAGSQVYGQTYFELLKNPDISADGARNTALAISLGTAAVANISGIDAKVINAMSGAARRELGKSVAQFATGKISIMALVNTNARLLGGKGIKSAGSEAGEELLENWWEVEVVNPITNNLEGTKLKTETTADEIQNIITIAGTVGLIAHVGTTGIAKASDLQNESLQQIFDNPEIYNDFLEGAARDNPEYAEGIRTILDPVIQEVESLNTEKKAIIAKKILERNELEAKNSITTIPAIQKRNQARIDKINEQIVGVLDKEAEKKDAPFYKIDGKEVGKDEFNLYLDKNSEAITGGTLVVVLEAVNDRRAKARINNLGKNSSPSQAETVVVDEAVEQSTIVTPKDATLDATSEGSEVVGEGETPTTASEGSLEAQEIELDRELVKWIADTQEGDFPLTNNKDGTVSYDGKKYDTEDEALRAKQREIIDGVYSDVPAELQEKIDAVRERKYETFDGNQETRLEQADIEKGDIFTDEVGNRYEVQNKADVDVPIQAKNLKTGDITEISTNDVTNINEGDRNSKIERLKKQPDTATDTATKISDLTVENLAGKNKVSGDALLEAMREAGIKPPDIAQMIKDGTIEYTDGKKPCLKFGNNPGFKPGGTWEVIKKFKGKSHNQGGIDIAVSNGGIKMSKGKNQFKAKFGVLISAK